MHKDYLGKLASQNNFVHSVFAASAARPFEQANTFVQQPLFVTGVFTIELKQYAQGLPQ